MGDQMIQVGGANTRKRPSCLTNDDRVPKEEGRPGSRSRNRQCDAAGTTEA
jgi:hypothetical protein